MLPFSYIIPYRQGGFFVCGRHRIECSCVKIYNACNFWINIFFSFVIQSPSLRNKFAHSSRMQTKSKLFVQPLCLQNGRCTCITYLVTKAADKHCTSYDITNNHMQLNGGGCWYIFKNYTILSHLTYSCDVICIPTADVIDSARRYGSVCVIRTKAIDDFFDVIMSARHQVFVDE